MALTNDEILEAVKSLNNHYGYGDVTGIKIDWDMRPPPACGLLVRGRITVKGTSMRPTEYRFKVEGRTVYFRGHQRQVPADYYVLGEIYRASKPQDEDGPKFLRTRPHDPKSNDFEYVVYLGHRACGMIVDSWDSNHETSNGMPLQYRTAQQAIREIQRDVENGLRASWFTLHTCHCGREAQKEQIN